MMAEKWPTWDEVEADLRAAGRIDEAAVTAHRERMRAEQRVMVCEQCGPDKTTTSDGHHPESKRVHQHRGEPMSEQKESTMTALKRALWCRWWHRYRWQRTGKTTTARLDGLALVLTAGPHRNCCWACENHPPMSRAYRKWLAS